MKLDDHLIQLADGASHDRTGKRRGNEPHALLYHDIPTRRTPKRIRPGGGARDREEFDTASVRGQASGPDAVYDVDGSAFRDDTSR